MTPATLLEPLAATIATMASEDDDVGLLSSSVSALSLGSSDGASGGLGFDCGQVSLLDQTVDGICSDGGSRAPSAEGAGHRRCCPKAVAPLAVAILRCGYRVSTLGASLAEAWLWERKHKLYLLTLSTT